MLKPIPAKIMRTTITVKACTGTDRYQKPTYTEYTVKKVHLQPTNEIRKTADNTDCVLRSLLFVDKQHSTPFLDWDALAKTAHDLSGDVKVVCHGEEYTVFIVDKLKDDTDCFHHWEIGLR